MRYMQTDKRSVPLAAPSAQQNAINRVRFLEMRGLKAGSMKISAASASGYSEYELVIDGNVEAAHFFCARKDRDIPEVETVQVAETQLP